MDKHTLTAKSQASRTSLLPVFICLIGLQPFCTSHCYLISNTHSTFTCLSCPQLLHTSHCITFLDKHNVATLITSKPPLFYLYLLSGSKTCNSKVDICYPDSTKVYGCVKTNTVLLDPIINYNQFWSEIREPSNRRRRTNASRSQHENSYAGSSSLVKLSCKSGKLKMVDTFSTSPTHTHNSTTDEKRHPRKPDERNTPVEGSNMRTAQVNAGRTLSTQLRARTTKNAACRLKDLHTCRMETARTTYATWKLKELHTGRMETTRTPCTTDREIDNARREIRKEEDSVRRYRLPQSNRNNPGKSLNSFSCKNPSIHRNKQQDKSRL